MPQRSKEREWEKKLEDKDQECQIKIEQIKAHCEQRIQDITQHFNEEITKLNQNFTEQLAKMTAIITKQMQVIHKQMQGIAPQTSKSDAETLQDLKNSPEKQITVLPPWKPPPVITPPTFNPQLNTLNSSFFSGSAGNFDEVPKELVQSLTTKSTPKKQKIDKSEKPPT